MQVRIGVFQIATLINFYEFKLERPAAEAAWSIIVDGDKGVSTTAHCNAGSKIFIVENLILKTKTVADPLLRLS